MVDTAYTQCIKLSPQTVLIGVPDGRCWLIDVAVPKVTALPASVLAIERTSLAASLVEGAICAGLTRTERVTPAGSYTLLRYIRWLAGNYVFAGQTPSLFRRGAQRLSAAGRHDLAEFALNKAAEEAGHAGLAYRDLEALGLPAAKVVRLIQPPSANVFAGRFRAYIESSDPIALFGFSYCLERIAIERDAAFIRRIETICPSGSSASRFLKVHSATGSDSAHVHEQLAVFESFSGAELTTVACTAYETAEMLAHQPVMDQELSDEEIDRRLRLEGIEISRAIDAETTRER